jgi:hypothetical protein
LSLSLYAEPRKDEETRRRRRRRSRRGDEEEEEEEKKKKPIRNTCTCISITGIIATLYDTRHTHKEMMSP